MYNILICDDQPDIVSALKIYLAPEGYQLFEASTGKQALQIVQQEDLHLILLDIKHIDPEGHKTLTGHDNAGILAFARYLDEKKIPVWIRHVVVPGWTDDDESLTALGRFMAQLKSVKALDVLPYHTLGVRKYQELGIPYPLEGVEPLEQKDAERARSVILGAYREAKMT